MNDQFKHPLRPSYFNWGGSLAKRERHAGRPKVWTGKEWVWVGDLFKFDHEAHYISREEAEEHAKSEGIKDALPRFD